MSKLIKKDHSPLKFDTSQANINCFISPKSKTKHSVNDRNLRKNKKKGRGSFTQNIQFQDKAFLQSVISKILTDSDSQGINQLIESMVFPSSDRGQTQNNKDKRRQEIQLQQMSQIFRNFDPFNKLNYTQKLSFYEQNNQFYQRLSPQLFFDYQEKLSMTTTLHSSLSNSYVISPRDINTNPQIQAVKNMNSLLSMGYSYNYYTQANSLYQRQLMQRKRRTVSGEEAQQFRIVAQKIQNDGRTTLMIRHIPNKYTQDMLLEEIGKNHRLHINFLYLPVDHYNSCNVGYAFANFIHTKFILEFYKEFNGRRWDRFNSEKICELAYARIQGTINLMDHFHNNSGQMRGFNMSKNDQRKKSLVELDQNAIKDINIMVNHQKVEDN